MLTGKWRKGESRRNSTIVKIASVVALSGVFRGSTAGLPRVVSGEITHQKCTFVKNKHFVAVWQCGSVAAVSINSPARTHVYILGNSRHTATLPQNTTSYKPAQRRKRGSKRLFTHRKKQKNKGKCNFFAKLFAHIKKKQYLCTAFPPNRIFCTTRTGNMTASLAQLARARDL